ncbi:MAG: MarR family transcriptional regulator [Oscillospiraceae bacterium]|nr:MarR family transcriptional regulator [Oscillospiraceae bacterium]
MATRFNDGSPERLFHAVHRKRRIAVDKMLAQRGIGNIGQPLILSILSQQEGGIIASQKELARLLRVSPATVTVSLKSMERDGYVKKLVRQEDLRCKPIAITEKGRQAVELIDDVFETLDHGMYRGFSDGEKQMISGFYQRILNNLDAVSAGDM